MIAAVASDLGIGKDGKLLFHIKEDMAWFRSHTLHNVVVMGRKTLESFPGGRPLPERTHIVLSHKKHENTENVIWVTSVEEALAKMEKLPGGYGIMADDILSGIYGMIVILIFRLLV